MVKQATPREKRELLYLMSGWHGSSWYALLQMFTAHCQTSMKSRVAVARIIMENYEMEAATIGVSCPENVQPDLKFLKHAIEQGKNAVIENGLGYTTVGMDSGTEDIVPTDDGESPDV